jgi:hypothetical protein
VSELSGALLEGVIARLTRPDYHAFHAQLQSSGYCARPVRLVGHVDVCDAGGVRRQVWTTAGEPDGVLRKACGNRREAVCGPCAERYRNDAYQLTAAGLRGGKGIPESVIGHPAVFASLTAPSFGPVHAHKLAADGRPLRCRPRRDAPLCPHGIPVACNQKHGPDDPCVGEPLCLDCFDYEGAVVWNNYSGELWRRFTIYVPRKLAKLTGITQKRLHEQVRVSYLKVAEYQRRGLIHFHPIIRLDRRMPDYRADELHPPDRRFTSQLLEQAVRAAIADVKVKVPAELGGHEIRWGEQLDVQQLSTDDEERKRHAGYLAKYATKSTEQAGGLLHRIDREDVDTAPVSEHVRRYMRAAFTLDDRFKAANPDDGEQDDEPAACMIRPRPAPATSRHPVELVQRVLHAMSTGERIAVRLRDGGEHVGQITRRSDDGLVLDTGHAIALADVQAITTAPPAAPKRNRNDRRLAKCAHALGYRGHCLTKSRRFSIRFKDLRDGRTRHVHQQILATSTDRAQRELAELDANEQIKTFDFDGVGHLTTADAYLAAKAAARAREDRELAREALYSHDNRGGREQCEAPQDQTWAA